MNQQGQKRASMGRQKIEIKKIEKTSQLQVTFSKRRTGIFKKAGELGLLCGADVGVIVTSPAGKIFAFGNPSADSVVDRYIAGDDGPVRGPAGEDGGRRVQQLCKNYERAMGKLEEEKERKRAVAEGRRGERFWWEESVEGLGVGELEQYAAMLEGLKRNVRKRADEVTAVGGLRLNLWECGRSGGGC